jgi:hypothetical protein
MSSYASYCQDQVTDCARRARLASSSEGQLTADVWAFAGSGLQSRQRGRVVPGGNASDEVEASSFRFSDVDLERETTHANADARSL